MAAKFFNHPVTEVILQLWVLFDFFKKENKINLPKPFSLHVNIFIGSMMAVYVDDDDGMMLFLVIPLHAYKQINNFSMIYQYLILYKN